MEKTKDSMKTVFVTLLSGVVVGNFDMPGGVLDQFVKRRPKNTRLVFLALQGLEKKIQQYLEGDSVVLESIKKTKPPRGLQKLFQFFYSYLIFTDTTRILATFGARADVPPAGGNRHLAFVKTFLANTFGKSIFVKTRFVPRLFALLFQGRPHRNLFEKYQPSVVFLSGIATLADAEFLLEAKRRGIPTVGMACNWDHLNKYYIPMRADYLLVQNEPMLREAVELQDYEPARVFPVGFAQFDAYARFGSGVVSREAFFKKFGIPHHKKLILFISGAAYALDEPDILTEIVRWIEQDKFGLPVHLMIRPYVIARDRDAEEAKYRQFKNNPSVAFNSFRRDESEETRNYYLAMLYYADVVIPIFSTMAIEAAMFDKPTISIGFDGYQKRPFHQSVTRLEHLTHFKHVLKTGSVTIVRSFDELYQHINRYLHAPEADSAQRKALVEKMCYRPDGRASERVADFVLHKA